MLNLVCCLEEPSARNVLEGILPRLFDVNTICISYLVFEGKQDLEKKLQKRVRLWQKPNSLFLVMRDQDSGDCKIIKSGLQTRIETTGQSERTLIRIACHELETFFLGDLRAVEVGLNITGIAKKQKSKKFRDPDRLANAAEELTKITKNKYRKLAGSRAISPHLRLDGRGTSRSFNNLVDGLKTLIQVYLR